MATPSFRAPKGTRDILAPDSARWRALVDVFAGIVEGAGYQLVIPPMFEDIGVFSRIGDATDIVQKEMYDFTDRGGRHIALRPEQTASVVRSFVQHRPATPWKAWYSGPNFRYERSQKGRYRQFDQVGIEVLGPDDPWLDAEVIALGWRFYLSLGLTRVEVAVNSLGDSGDRARYEQALRAHFEANLEALSEASRETLARNPLRVLDSKRPEDAELIAAAPAISVHLSDASAEHHADVLSGLDALSVPYRIAPHLVRGLDYYRRTTFEFAGLGLDAAQNAVGGGGRYDGLAADLGGPETPGVGFALGVDRTLLACDAEGVFEAPDASVDVFVIDTTGGREALMITEELRRSGFSADRAFGDRSMKAQMKAADRSGARLGAIVGEDELARDELSLRDLRGEGGQRRIGRSDLVTAVADQLQPRK